MYIELAHFALILAFCLSILGAVIPLYGASVRDRRAMALADPAMVLQLALVLFAFGVLTWAFVSSDFSLRIVVANSHTDKPMLYKVAGVWGNHEGSLLLWVLILTLFGTCASWFGGNLPATLKARVLGVQSSIVLAFLAFTLFTSNPFDRIALPPFNGQDLNPLLQDPGLAFHPPFLYLGYVGLSMSFSFAIAALLEGRVDAAWGRWVRPWTLGAWIFLTIGIGLGSWWAYYELGWGGFWFWDPVENASFMPWLLAGALLHSAIVVEKREALKSWTILLAILAFGFSLMGTFIVRSGLLTSVHAFANDPERGVFILLILGVFLGGGLILFTWRAAAMESRAVFSLVSRESALVVNNLLLAVSCFVVFVGTVWPLVAEMFFDRVLSVGPPFFNAAFTPFVLAIAVILPIGSVLPWKRGRFGPVFKRLWPLILFMFVLVAAVWVFQSGNSILGPIGVALGVWLVAGAIIEIWQRAGTRHRFSRLRGLPRADWGKAIAHSGLGITIIGVAAMLTWQVEDIRVANIGDSYEVSGWTVTLESVRQYEGPNYVAEQALVTMTRGGATFEKRPERRFYPVAQMPTTEAGIANSFWRDLYVVIGERQEQGGWAMRIYIKPLANWIWAGAIIMALGGLMSLSDRRFRVAAAARKVLAGVPAE